MTKIPRGDKSYIGKTVTVTVDRPIGTHHPKHPEIVYPINYGYVEGLLGGDGEEQDVYILGVDKSVDKAECVVIATIMRTDDNEDKWVGVPSELVGTELCCECNIVNAVHFQEQFHTSEIFALYEKTCGAVMYTGDRVTADTSLSRITAVISAFRRVISSTAKMSVKQLCVRFSRNADLKRN